MRITDFPELVTATGNDLLVTVDIANDLTKKIKLENLPISTATTVALATKQNLLVSGTNIKTVNSTSLLGSGDIALQPTLVSGTNIKTINSISLLGSGDITIAANPSGVSGAIQFSDGSAFASDAANLFWNNTTKRLGIGTNAPSTPLHVVGQTTISSSDPYADLVLSPSGAIFTGIKGRQYYIDIYSNATRVASWRYDGQSVNKLSVGGTVGNPMPTPQVQIQGSGSTSATTSFLVQNSAGTAALTIKDDLSATFGSNIIAGTFSGQCYIPAKYFINNQGLAVFGDESRNASAVLQANSTTLGFLPPRMTTTQKNAIATPAAGLVVYDSTTNKLCCYNGSTWNDLF